MGSRTAVQKHTHSHTHTDRRLKRAWARPGGHRLRHSSVGVNAAGGDDKNALIEGPSPVLVNSKGLEDGGLGYSG